MRHRATIVVVASAGLLVACGPETVPVDDAYRAEIESAWVEREARLVADDGWLTVVGLDWLEPGVQTIGSAPASDIELPDGAPPVVGALELTGEGEVVFAAEDNPEITVNGGPAATGVLATDADGPPDLVQAGRISFHLIERGGRIGVRVKDPEAPARRAFRGLDHFPIDPAWRVTATLEPYAEPRQVEIPTVIGTPSTMLAPGLLRFEVDGRPHSLEPYVSEPGDSSLFIVFRDATSGASTYGAGRFLDAERVEGSERVVLDFNLAVNPPCAFTPYATCPLPTPENTLTVAVTAGETYGGEGH